MDAPKFQSNPVAAALTCKWSADANGNSTVKKFGGSRGEIRNFCDVCRIKDWHISNIEMSTIRAQSAPAQANRRPLRSNDQILLKDWCKNIVAIANAQPNAIKGSQEVAERQPDVIRVTLDILAGLAMQAQATDICSDGRRTNQISFPHANAGVVLAPAPANTPLSGATNEICWHP